MLQLYKPSIGRGRSALGKGKGDWEKLDAALKPHIGPWVCRLHSHRSKVGCICCGVESSGNCMAEAYFKESTQTIMVNGQHPLAPFSKEWVGMWEKRR